MNNDLISREYLRDAFDNLCCHNCKTCRNFRKEGCSFYRCDLIDNAPTVDIKDELAGAYNEGYMCGSREAEKARPQGEWISVSERMPEEKINPNTKDLEKVLCSTIWGDVRPYKYGKPIGYDKAHFLLGGGIMDEYVTAWQPLPEPYKKGGAE